MPNTRKFNVNKELVGKEVTAKVTLNNYRFPHNRVPVSGEFAIVVFTLKEVIKGKIDGSCIISSGHIVVTGRMPRIEDGIEYIFSGKLVVDKQWGPQYTCDTIQMSYNMEDKEDQKKFFSFFLTERQIDMLFSSFDNPMELLKNKNIAELTKIKGIGPMTADRLCQKYAENRNNGRAYVELKDLGLTKNAIDKIILQFGSADIAIDIIKSNPYSLITLVRGYGWEKADKIAQNQGFGHGCKERCIAYATYKLEKLSDEDGNSRTEIDEFMDDIESVCTPTEKPQLAEWLKEYMVGDQDFEEIYAKIQKGEKDFQKPLFYYSKDSRCIGLFSLRVLEKQISDQLKKLVSAPSGYTFNQTLCEKIIKDTEQGQGFEYTHEQRKAIWSILNSNVSILTGSAGCGKTSTVKPLIKIFEYYNLNVAQCALSGRASSLLTEYTGLEGKTIHRLLNYIPDQERFNHNAKNPLPYDVIILDETSMVGEELFYSLITSIKPGSKLIMLGDTKQLPPISVGNVLGDCIGSGYVPSNTLTILHRQAMRSGITAQAIHVCEGKALVKNDFAGSEIRGELQDFKIIANADSAVVHSKAIEEFKYLYKDRHIPADDIQIVVPVRSKGVNSCKYFNAEVQQIVNGPSKDGVIVDIFDGAQKYQVTYKPGDRIIVVKNNYHAKTLDNNEAAIFNGNMGHILKIDESNMIVEINGDTKVIIPRTEWNNIAHSYAVTCHKCVTDDTIVYTENGYKTIKELNNGANENEMKPFDQPVKVYNGEKYEESTKFYNAGTSPVLNITTQYGYQIKCSTDHHIIRYENGEENLVNAEDLRVGDYLCVPMNFNYCSDSTSPMLPPEWQIINLGKRSVVYNRPANLTEEFAEFLGLFVADGCISNGGFHYYKKDIKTVQHMQKLTKSLFGYETTIRRHGKNTNAWGIECSSKDILQFLSNIDGIQPNKKDIPNCIQTAPSIYQCAFLRGLFEDGGVHTKNNRFDMIELATKQEELARHVQLMLQQNGILSSLRQYKKNSYSKIDGHQLKTYKIMIFSDWAKEFYNKIKFFDDEKNKKLESCLTLNDAKNSNPTKIIVSEDKTRAYLPITKIENSIENVYCLYVPTSHMFVQNGILGGNCQGSQAKYVIIALDNSSYPLLMREWLYTAITRARKYCALVGQPKAINTATRVSNIKVKKTWLKGDLYELYKQQHE